MIRLLLSALSGIFFFLGCPKFHIWQLAWVGFLLLFIAMFDRRGLPAVKHPFVYGLVAGFFFIAGGFSWMLPFLVRFGDISTVVAAPIFLLFVLYHSLVFAIFASLICFLRQHLNISLTLIVAIGWVTCEYLFPCIFPWYAAVTQAFVPVVIQVADLTGPLGVSFVLVLSSGLLFEVGSLLLQKRISFRALCAPLVAFGLIVTVLIYGKVRLHQIDALRSQAIKIKLGVVQPNVGMDVKFRTAPEEQLNKLQQASIALEAQGADLIVWPESSYPVARTGPFPLPRDLSEDLPESNRWRIRRQFSKPLLFGAMTEDVKGIYNTALMLDSEGKITGSVEKNYLLIFGEYIPYWQQFRWLKKWIPHISNTTPGTKTATFPFHYQGKQYFLGPMICYEDIVPSFGRRLMDTENAPHLLINFTNDAWFGDTAEPYEHLALSVFRAVEHRLDLVRATNTGVSAYIDAAGRVYAQTQVSDPHGQHLAATMALHPVALLTAGGYYEVLGDSFARICVLLTLGFFLLAKYCQQRPIHLALVLAGVLFLHGVILLCGIVVPQNSIPMAYTLLTHRNESAIWSIGILQSMLFQNTLILWGAMMLGSFLLGIFLLQLKRNSQKKRAVNTPLTAHLEIVGSLLCVTVLPVALFGRMEGNTLGVILGTAMCSIFAFVGHRLGLRIGDRAKIA